MIATLARTALAAVAVLALVGMVFGVTLHREGLYALPGQTILVRFDADIDHATALAHIADAGAALVGYGPWRRSFRLHVIDSVAPRRLAVHGLVYRDPLESLKHCFGPAPDLSARLRH